MRERKGRRRGEGGRGEERERESVYYVTSHSARDLEIKVGRQTDRETDGKRERERGAPGF